METELNMEEKLFLQTLGRAFSKAVMLLLYLGNKNAAILKNILVNKQTERSLVIMTKSLMRS